MDEDWRNTFEILMWPLGPGPGGVAPKGPKSNLYKRSHNAYQIEGNLRAEYSGAKRLQRGDVWGSLEVKK